MKKIIGLAIAALIVITIAGIGTFAFFSDTETSTGNIFTAGTIDLEVNNENPWTSKIDAAWEDYKPDQTVAAATITLENVGTNPMDVWMKITKTATSTGTTGYSGVSSEAEYVAEGGPSAWAAIDNIDTKILYELTVGSTDEIEFDDNYTINEIHDQYIWIGNIAAAGTLTIDQNFKLDSSAGNEYQGDDMTFTIDFYAQQSEGDNYPTSPGAPGTELTGYERP